MAGTRIHIGHHFFGAGNLGDDLMMAGFLHAAQSWTADISLTCCTPHDVSSQRRRFSTVEWLPYEDAVRRQCIQECDIWLGLGDTPFQFAGGNPWLLDHLVREAAWCREVGRPMYYLGVGVNEREAIDAPQTRPLLDQAEHLWMRDAHSAELLRPAAGERKVTTAADLAHIALQRVAFPSIESGATGFVLNFEDPRQYDIARLAALIQTGPGVRWLVQEVRPLPGSESELYARLPEAARTAAQWRAPDYARSVSVEELLGAWGTPERLFTSRYHGALIGAWMGCRTIVFRRSDKLAGAARSLGLAMVEDFADTAAVWQALAEAQPIAPEITRTQAELACSSCEEFLTRVVKTRRRTRPSSATGAPSRVLLVRPDTYGDLVLFEPALRLLRQGWPHAAIAVILREPYADLTPLLPDGIQWIPTRCNPYREGARDCREALAALREAVVAFDPDCVVAACYEQTWLEPAVASFAPGARTVRAGGPAMDVISRAALETELGQDARTLFSEEVSMEPLSLDWEKNLRLAGYLLDWAHPARELPRVTLPDGARQAAEAILTQHGLARGNYLACAAAGTANVTIKAWPVEAYAQTLVWVERELGIRALLVGHEDERERLHAVQEAARAGGATPELWCGQNGGIALLGALLESATAYFGNDTGAVHLASALGRPVASIFGGGHWPRFKPVARRAATVVQPLPCFGCGWDCLFGYAPCVSEIPVAAACEALDWLLAQPNEEGEREFHAGNLPAAAHALIAGAVSRREAADAGEGAPSMGNLAALMKQLDASETDRMNRMAVIESQGAEISRLQAEADRWITEAREIWPRLDEAANARNLLAAQLADLQSQFDVAQEDRGARGIVIERQGAELTRLHAETDRWLRRADELQNEVAKLNDVRLQLGFEADDLRKHFAASEADRAARGAVIEAQGAGIARLHGEVHHWLGQAQLLQDQAQRWEQAHAEQLAEAERRREEHAGQAEVTRQQAAEINALGRKLDEVGQARERLAAELATSHEQVAAAAAWRARLEGRWTVKVLQKLSLWPG